MRKPRWLAVTFATTTLMVAATAHADVKVGVTAAVNPQAIGEPPTEPERMLLVGGDNFVNEKITTGPEGQAQLLFLDGSSISVGPAANLTIDQYVYDTDTKIGKFAISAAQGVFKLVGGAISKTNEIVITTPVATAGIRGGIANIDSRPGQPMHAQFLFGTSLRVTAQGVTQEVTRPGFEIIVAPGQPPSPPSRMTTAQVRGTFSQFQGRSRTSGSGQPGQMGQVAGAGGLAEPPQDQALAQSNLSSSTGSNQAPQTLATVGTLNSFFSNGVLNPNTQNNLLNAITDSSSTNQLSQLAPETLYGHFYCCDTFISGSFNTSTLAATPNPSNNFNFSATLSGNDLSFTVPVGGNGSTPVDQTFNFSFAAGASTAFSNLALLNGNSISGNIFVSPDRQFFDILGTVAVSPGNSCGGGGGNSSCKFGLFGGVPTTSLPTSGVSTYNLSPSFDNIPFVSNLSGGNSNNNTSGLLTQVGGPGTAISPLYVRWSPITNPALAAGNDQRATLMQASLIISGTGANQQSGLFGVTGAFFQEQNSTVAMGAGLVGYALPCATCVSVRVGSGVSSAQIATATGLGNAIYGPNAEYIVAVPDILTASPGQPNTRTPAEQIQIPFGTPASAQANNDNFFVTIAAQNPASSPATQAAANGSQTTQTLVGYTGGGIETASGGSVTTSGFGGNLSGGSYNPTAGPNVSITTDASTNRMSATFNVSDALVSNQNYGLNFGSTTGFNDGRSSFITDQLFAARDAVTSSGGPTSTYNGSTAGFSRLFMVSSAAVPIDFQSFAGAGVTACTCSFMQWGWWIGEVQAPGANPDRFLGTWVAGTLPGASQITPALGTATFNGHAIATVGYGSGPIGSGGGQYIAAGNYTQTWNFASASGTATISNFDRGGVLNPSGITLTAAVSAANAGGGVSNQVNFATTSNGLAGNGLAGALAGSFFQNPKNGDPIAGVGGSFAVTNIGSTYKAAGTFAACRAGTPC
jgi:hypothetical protein